MRSDEFTMPNKMLIDATHPEETRVVVLRGSRVDEFDFESASKKQLRGNIYLAKVIRVEPSLQAAFVDYGGNRHGFLAFSEVHPDYYQIPVSDRQALLEDEAREEHEEEEERRPRRSRRRRGERTVAVSQHGGDEVVSEAVTEGDGRRDETEAGERRSGHAVESNATDPTPSTAQADPQGGDEPELRPVELDASQTPPYDDPTAELIERASEIHNSLDVSGDSEPAPVPAAPVADPVAAARHRSVLAEPTVPQSDAAPAADGAEGLAVDEDREAGKPSDHAPTSDADIDTGSPTRADLTEAGHIGSANEHEARHERSFDDSDESEDQDEEEHVDQVGGDAMEEIPRRSHRPRRQYKIQEVIKRRQVLLVQVVKEERGNKGAALTTYLSLAGRYSVLMPNTARGGGISRKITDAGDRQRLKSIAQELEVPDGMGVILRTAGAMRSKPEVKRDFEYLMRMWETVRETTLQSTAPTLVYEEGSLIKRAIRDLYNSDVEEIVVAGEEAYREAKDFMRLLTPSHVKNVQLWRDPAPLFTKAGAEAQLDAMFSSQVTLKSGGYLVINQTEALVAIDVNSGRSTREHNIEDTALRTNLEAADEVARQLRLRDLAGLIVVDFIDMEETRNNRAVERRVKDALKDDRARIQIGRISHFGLLEMSRQRIRTGVLEGSTEICHHCAGAGMVRSTASIALHVLRVLEDALITDASRNVTVRTRGKVALYVLNFKRAHLDDIEGRFGVAVTFEDDEHLTGTVYCGIERGEPASGTLRPMRPMLVDEPADEVIDEAVEEIAAEANVDETANGEDKGEPRRRRRRRGRGRDRESSGISQDAPQPADDALGLMSDLGEVSPAVVSDGSMEEIEPAVATEPSAEDPRGRRRRSRRGGGRRPREAESIQIESGERTEPEAVRLDGEALPLLETPVMVDEPLHRAAGEVALPLGMPSQDEAPSRPEAGPVSVGERTPEMPSSSPVAADVPSSPPVEAPNAAISDQEPAETRAPRPEPVSSELDPSRPKRSGWWQRAKATLSG